MLFWSRKSNSFYLRLRPGRLIVTDFLRLSMFCNRAKLSADHREQFDYFRLLLFHRHACGQQTTQLSAIAKHRRAKEIRAVTGIPGGAVPSLIEKCDDKDSDYDEDEDRALEARIIRPNEVHKYPSKH